MPTVPPLTITGEKCAELQHRIRAHTTPQRAAKRARVVLLAADVTGPRLLVHLL